MYFDSGPLTASLESLLYRGESPLYHELKMIFTDVLAGTTSALERLAKVIKRHTHLDVSIAVAPFDIPDLFITFPPFDVNNVLRPHSAASFEGVKFDVRLYAQLLSGRKAATTERGAVTGAFTKIPAVITISTGALAKELFTAAELAAAVLHEIGHFYNYFDVMGRTLATSFAIRQTQQALTQAPDPAQRYQIIDTAAKMLEFDDIDTEALAASGEEQALEYVFVRSTVAKLQADMGHSSLYGVETEFMADSYAVHSGAAAPLTSFLVKLAKYDGHRQTRSTFEYVVVEACKVAFVAGVGIYKLPLGILSLMAGLVVASFRMEALERNTPMERLESVHGDLVNLLKDTRLTSEQKEALLSDVQFVSGLREQLKEHQTVFSRLLTTLAPSYRHAYKQIQLQRDIAKLVNNELFAHAARLSTVVPSP